MKKISEYLFLWGIGGWIYYTAGNSFSVVFSPSRVHVRAGRDLYDVFAPIRDSRYTGRMIFCCRYSAAASL